MFFNYYLNFIKYFTNKINYQKYLTLQLDITNLCNLNCIHCYHPNHINKNSLKTSDWIEILYQYKNLLKKLHLLPDIIICGGEPIINKDLFIIINEAKKIWPNVRVSVLTNGTLLNDKVINFFKNNNVQVQVSIDGSNENTHDFFRGKGNFKKTIFNIKLLLEKSIKVDLLAILSKRSSLEIEQFFLLAKGLNVNSMNFTRFIPTGIGKDLALNNEELPIYKFELKKAYESIIYWSNYYNIKSSTDAPLFNILDNKLGSNSRFGFQAIVISYDGKLKVSSRSTYEIGNVLESGLENLFLKNENLKKIRTGKIVKCNSCSHLLKCGGDRNIAFAISGSFLGEDIGCWLN